MMRCLILKKYSCSKARESGHYGWKKKTSGTLFLRTLSVSSQKAPTPSSISREWNCVILNSLKGGYKLYPSFRYKQMAALKRCVVPIWKGCSALHYSVHPVKESRTVQTLDGPGGGREDQSDDWPGAQHRPGSGGLSPARVFWSLSRNPKNRVGGKQRIFGVFLLFPLFPTSHTTVRAVRHTAVPYTLCNWA